MCIKVDYNCPVPVTYGVESMRTTQLRAKSSKYFFVDVTATVRVTELLLNAIPGPESHDWLIKLENHLKITLKITFNWPILSIVCPMAEINKRGHTRRTGSLTSLNSLIMGVFDLKDQLVFYGQYHSNKYNIAVHMCFVPLILWTVFVMLASLPVPELFPSQTLLYISPYAYLEWTWALPLAIIVAGYYLLLEPIAAITYLPILSTMIMTASPIAHGPSGTEAAMGLFVLSWIAQFTAHAVAEKRSPALLDNLAGALILAPFFVHFELLFALGYRPQLQKEITNGVGIEVTKFRREAAERNRKKQ